MKNIAIICEYNPMHNGHIHQINKIKEIYPDSNIIILMSGSFVQRGEPSILDKFDKAEISLKNGVDLVLEMPTAISVQSANYFSYFSVKILESLNFIDYLSFGIESDTSEFNNSFNTILENEEKIWRIQKQYIELGHSYKRSYAQAIIDLKLPIAEDFNQPNNTLALQYMFALNSLNSNIKPLLINRKDGGYNNEIQDNFDFQSATTIRKMIKDNKDISKYVPKETKDKINFICELDDFTELFIYKSQVMNVNPDDIAGYENGMLNLLVNNFENNLSTTIEKCHNKRYSKSRLRRFVINYLLDVKDSDIYMLKYISFIRPLAFNDKGRMLISELKNNDEIEIIHKISDTNNLSIENKRILEIDHSAYMLRNIKYPKKNIKDFTNKAYKKN